jgi:hypothetical protein
MTDKIVPLKARGNKSRQPERQHAAGGNQQADANPDDEADDNSLVVVIDINLLHPAYD